MNFHHMISSSLYHPQAITQQNLTKSWDKIHQPGSKYCFKSRIYQQQLRWRPSQIQKLQEEKKVKKRDRFIIINLRKDPLAISKKKGTIAGAVALIIGTSIGSGILALPKKTSPAGLLPSSISITLCWAFLLIEALLLVEINVGLLKKKKLKVENDELEVISIRTMAQETLGEWGGTLATITYVFLGYTSMIAYSSKSGEILCHLTKFPESISGIFFTTLFSILISIGGTRTTDQVNQWLTASMIGLLVLIEILAVVFGGWSGLEGSVNNWERVPETFPVMIFALVYHDLTPVLCAYLEGDLTRIRASIFLGSIVPLLALLIWEAIALGLSNNGDQVSDPVELLMNVRWSGFSFMVEAFSLLAIGTSLIGTLLSFSEFFKEQLSNESYSDSKSTRFLEEPNLVFHIINWWKRSKVNITATVIVIGPPLVVSTLVPNAFSAATDIAGGYCMTMLYGVLPPAMAWAMNRKEGQISEQIAISKVGVALFGVGLFACGIVVEQILQDLSLLHP
ncbi:hypothetical protein ACJIZ3_005919 [Penstemon smallii]|uniref:Tyrosine-specific transport protein n=1 Tax=Penstemon smallii TaxID=265156 RepID=A0ABD3S687_9LAMI